MGKIRVVPFSENTAADHELVAALDGQAVKLLGCALVSAGTVAVSFKSDTTLLMEPVPLVANGQFILPITPDRDVPWAAVTLGEAFNLTLSAGIAVTGVLVLEVE